MILLILFLACMFVAAGAGILGAISDFRGLTIPNSYSAVIIIAFFAAYFFLWMGKHEGMFYALVTSHILAGVLIFGITAFMFGTRMIGAADSKLATAYAFWMGLPGLLPFLFYTALAGGVLGLAAMFLRKYKPVKAPRTGSWIAQVQAGENKVPYGIAIVIGALASFVKLGYFDLEALRSFLSV